MADIVDKRTRSRIMSTIRGANTRPELIVRKALHAAGFRYRLHRRDLPGTPDIVLPKYRAAIFVHGCFWHRHGGCHYATLPATRTSFWRKKLADNARRDAASRRALKAAGWRVFIVWECGLKHKPKTTTYALMRALRDPSAVAAEFPPAPPRPAIPRR